MRYFKRILSALIILTLVLFLSGCSKNKVSESKPPKKENPATGKTETETNTETEEIIEMPDIPIWEAATPDQNDTDKVEEYLGGYTLTYLENKDTLILSGKGALDNVLNESRHVSKSDEPNPFYLLEKLTPEDVATIVIDEGITSITKCFNGLNGLYQIYLPSTLETIDECFVDCASFTKVYIPQKVKTIRASFNKCGSLMRANLFSTLTIDDSFSECPYLNELYIPKDSILYNSFNTCDNLHAIRIGANVSCHDPIKDGCADSFGGSTPANAFFISEPLHADKATALTAGISKLKSPLSESKITILAEKEGEQPKNTTLPGMLRTTFDEQSGTLTLSGEGQVNSIYARSLLSKWHNGYETEPITLDAKVKKLIIEEGITALFNCFNDLTALEEIVFPKSLASVQLSFMGCTALKTLAIPKTCKEVSTHSFDGCTTLSDLTFEGAVKIAPWGGFHELDTLEEVVIPAKSEICSAFFECKNLKKVTFQSDVKIHKAAVDELNRDGVSCRQSFENLHKDCVFYLPKALYQQTAPRYEGNLFFTDYIRDLKKDNHVITD